MKLKTRLMTPLLIGATLCATALVQAQPDTRNAKGANPAALAQMGNWQNMTPEMRQEVMKQMVNQTLRDSMTHIGVDQATQNTVLQFAEVQEKSKQAVRDKARKVSLALLDNTQTDVQVAVLVKEFRQAVEEAKANHQADVQKLEELTGFSKKPKWEAFLTMMGLVGDETLYLQGVFGNYINAMGIMAEPPAAPEKPKQN